MPYIYRSNLPGMKKMLPLIALSFGTLFVLSCNKGDDNPYSDWRCTCFVTKYVYLTPTDTVLHPKLDTTYLTVDDVDKNTATTFCQQAASGYTDSAGSTAKCIIK